MKQQYAHEVPLPPGQLLDLGAIQGLIPHRHPFLFLAEVVILSDTEVEGVALWPAAHPILSGHFPTMPIVPGVCLVEALAQMAGVLFATAHNIHASHGRLAAVRHASFHAPLQADEAVHMTCQLRLMADRLFLAKGEGRREGNKVFAAEVMIAIPGKGDLT